MSTKLVAQRVSEQQLYRMQTDPEPDARYHKSNKSTRVEDKSSMSLTDSKRNIFSEWISHCVNHVQLHN